MVGLQFAAFQTKLGAKLNGLVNYDYWVPEPTLSVVDINDPQVARLLERTDFDVTVVCGTSLIRPPVLDAGEEFDVVSYLAAGPNRGKD